MSVDLKPYREAVEAEMQRAVAPPPSSSDIDLGPLYGMMQYHLGWLDKDFAATAANGGKRIRPVLCLLACEACDGDWRSALPAAAAIELVHNFSLVHDDIQDESSHRRHRRTVWSLWGIAQGINTGDTMWTLARRALLRLAETGHGAETVLQAVDLLDRACLSLCTGQYLDLSFEGESTVSVAAYLEMIAGKTAALLSASLAIGALLGGGNVNEYAALGHDLGLTFQIVDDILGVWGDPAVTGKSAASDILSGKKTLPILYAISWEAAHGRDDVRRILARAPLHMGDVPTVLELLDRCGAKAYAQEQARLYYERTVRRVLAPGAEQPRALVAIHELAASLVERTS